ncbi:MAG: hypothetical protein KatS3mg132_854 [Limisphaera sp.]|nr:MAG: hypothetical protein KatS3mg132_854 [Limisphaera sp.]
MGLLAWAGLASAAVREAAGPVQGQGLPAWFEPNVGQADARYRYVSQTRGAVHGLAPDCVTVWLASPATVAVRQPSRGEVPAAENLHGRAPGRTLHLRWLDADPRARAVSVEPLAGRVHYLLGSDPARWRRHVPLSGVIRFEQVYPGVDVVHRATDRMLEMEYHLAPGTRPEQIRFTVEGADRVWVGENGDLVMEVGSTEFRLHRPRAFQDTEVGRRDVACAFELVEGGVPMVRFRLGPYDAERPLVIDPVFRHSGYWGGNGHEIIWAVGTDAEGNGYLAGETTSAEWWVQAGGFQTNYGGGTAVGGDVFVAKISADGTRLIWLTYLGGAAHEAALAMAVDAAGAVYLTGFTASTNFPTRNPLQAAPAGEPDRTLGAPPLDAFVIKLTPAGDDLVYGTFFGGSGIDEGIGLAVDEAGRAVITGLTDSTNLPLARPLQSVPGGGRDAFVARLSADGTSLLFSSYLGGTNVDHGTGVAVDGLGRWWVTGVTQSTNFPTVHPIQPRINDPRGLATNVNTLPDAFVCRFSASDELEFATFLGGTFTDAAARIAADAQGNAYVVGTTESGDFPVTTTNLWGTVWTNRALADWFVTKIPAEGSTGWVYSVAFGGTARDEAWDVAVDGEGRVHIVGVVGSTNFPVWNVPEGGRDTVAGGWDAALVGLDPAGQRLEYAFYYGGTGNDYGYAVAADPAGHLWVGGRTLSTNLWVSGALQPAFAGGSGDAFYARLLQPPRLEVRLISADALELSWPAPSPEWDLLRLTNLAGEGVEILGAAPPATGGLHRVRLPLTSAPAFYRLRLR